MKHPLLCKTSVNAICNVLCAQPLNIHNVESHVFECDWA